MRKTISNKFITYYHMEWQFCFIAEKGNMYFVRYTKHLWILPTLLRPVVPKLEPPDVVGLKLLLARISGIDTLWYNAHQAHRAKVENIWASTYFWLQLSYFLTSDHVGCGLVNLKLSSIPQLNKYGPFTNLQVLAWYQEANSSSDERRHLYQESGKT